MNIPVPKPSITSNLLTTHSSLVATLTSFLTVFIHHTLYLRRIYPNVSFLATRAYNYPVRQNRHPDVCQWILDAVALIKDQLERNTVQSVALCIFECDDNRVLERWVINLHNFPAVEKREQHTPFDTPGPLPPAPPEENQATTTTTTTTGETAESKIHTPLILADLEASFRATLSRLTTSAGKLKPLPSTPISPEYSFTLTIEVKDTADRPVGRLRKEERGWIAAEPDPFDGDSTSPDEDFIGPRRAKLRRRDGDKTVPIRRLEAGQLRLEMWVEESRDKFTLIEECTTGFDDNDDNESGGKGKQPHFSLETGYDDLEGMDTHKAQPPNVATGYRRRVVWIMSGLCSVSTNENENEDEDEHMTMNKTEKTNEKTVLDLTPSRNQNSYKGTAQKFERGKELKVIMAWENSRS